MATSFHAISPDHPCITIATKKEERERERARKRDVPTRKFFFEARNESVQLRYPRTDVYRRRPKLPDLHAFLLHTNFNLTFSMHHPFPRKRRRHRKIEREQCPPSSMRVNDEVEKQKEKIEDRAPGGRSAALCLRERPAF